MAGKRIRSVLPPFTAIVITTAIACGCADDRTQSAAESPSDNPGIAAAPPSSATSPSSAGSSTASAPAGTTKGVSDALHALDPGPIIVPAPLGH